MLETSPALPLLPWGFWKTIGYSALIVFAVFASQIVVGIGVGIWAVATGNSMPNSEEIKGNGLILSLATMVSAPFSVFLSIRFARQRKSLPVKEYLAFRWPTREVAGRWCLGFIGLLIVTDLVTSLIDQPVPEFMINAFESAGFLPLLWFTLIVAAPVSEEFFFRGFLFTGLQYSRLGGWGTVFLTAFSWASIHIQYDIVGIGVIFVVGIFLGIVRMKTNSLWLCILLHGLMNFISAAQLALWLSSTPIEN